MASFLQAQNSSKSLSPQVLAWTGSGTVVSTNFAPETFQIRVTTQVPGWFAIDNLGTLPTTAGATGSYLPSGIEAEFITCSPGMLFSFSSTSTSSGSVSVCETA